MNSYPFIEQLFKNVLTHSIVMQGRLAVCPKYGSEINTDNLEAVITDLVTGQKQWRWPGVIMMPPISEANIKDLNGEWERYRIELWFLTTSFYTGTNQVKFPNKNTQTSTHTVLEDWHDMKRCAQDFIIMLGKLGYLLTPDQFPFRLPGNEKKLFDPLSFQGNSRLSGVRLTFKVDVWNGCQIEDYEAGSELNIQIPDLNIHPTHFH